MPSVRPEDSHCASDFWRGFNALPADVQQLARDKHGLWLRDTSARRLFFKKRQGTREDIWQVYVGNDHRALCLREGTEYTWFWIGTKQDALKLRGV